MTRNEFLARFPNASEAVIRANCVDAKPTVAPSTISSVPAKARSVSVKRKSRVPLTRNMGTWSEAAYWQRIRSCLRRMSIYWKPARAALLASRVPFNGPRGQKWAFLCADCQKLFKRRSVHLDHVIPCGTLRSYVDLGNFLERLLPEDPKAYQVRCHKCHQKKTNTERHLRPKNHSHDAEAITDSAATTPR